MKNKTIIDYLSFSGSPLLLERCKEMAKQRFMISDFSYQNQSQHPIRIAERENKKISYFAENLSIALGCDESHNFANRDLYLSSLDKKLSECDMQIASDCSFNDCYQLLISNIGIDMLDVLCHGEIESFVELLNDEITYSGNHWTLERRGGFSGYSHSAKLLCNGTQAGLVAWGAANFGYYVSFSGTGCAAVKMDVLHKALQQMPSVKITRVDIAFDDFQGSVSVPYLREQYENGDFITRGTPPSYCYIESGSLVPSDFKKKYGVVPDKGCTFYVGQRQNGKMFRGYEKGKQLDSKEYPDWVRHEVQIGNKSRIIPLDVLINSDSYFAGAYPALASILEDVEPVSISTSKIIVNAQLDKYLDVAKKQYGKFINFLSLIYDNPEIVIKKMTSGLTIHDIPDRLNMPSWFDNKEVLQNG
ncbi:replication initiation factor domain-containing protein [Vibrio cincinnatiensis]|uniref:replication initiation factor domain-containing protein n=1 Tax=Vibrio cincinnatiensis TaxID=675 RepID=UPI001F556008|nr:replication initiation factor domain-containing protein [Vibrio cincinnatiensis]